MNSHGQCSDLTTFDDFLNLPDPPSGHFELHHGQVILVPPRKHRLAEIQQALLELLAPLTRGRGFLTIEFPFRAPGTRQGKPTLALSGKIVEPELPTIRWALRILSSKYCRQAIRWT